MYQRKGRRRDKRLRREALGEERWGTSLERVLKRGAFPLLPRAALPQASWNFFS